MDLTFVLIPTTSNEHFSQTCFRVVNLLPGS